MRGSGTHKDLARGAARSIATQICGHCLADIGRQRQLTADRSLPAHRYRTRVPIDVVELEAHDFTATQAQTGEQ
jgi:hypothetical protein